MKSTKLITQIKPRFWCLENPADTQLHKQAYMKPFEKYISNCSYCMYGRPYRKNTTIWNNFNLKLKTCTCKGKHAVKLGGDYGGTPGCRKWAKRKHKISIPATLIQDIVRQLKSKTTLRKLPMEPPPARTPPKQKIIINENKNNELITGNNNHASLFVPTEREIRNFAKITHPHAVTTYLDKNGGAGIVMCKKHHYNINKKHLMMILTTMIILK